MSSRRRRSMSTEEVEIWHTVIRTVAPLKGRRAPASTGDLAKNTADCGENKRSAPPLRPLPTDPAKDKPRLPGLAPIARQARKKIAGGTISIDARIDLHGMTQSEAHVALLRFLRRAQGNDARYILVITGKGGRDGSGVLRRQVPLWLSLPEFRPYVVGFEDAHVAHGGTGALYLQVRRTRSAG